MDKATIVVPGLLTVSRTEAITAWRALCSDKAPASGNIAPRSVPREKNIMDEKNVATPEGESDHSTLLGLKDGRDVYLLRFESEKMLKTGRAIDLWGRSYTSSSRQSS